MFRSRYQYLISKRKTLCGLKKCFFFLVFFKPQSIPKLKHDYEVSSYYLWKTKCKAIFLWQIHILSDIKASNIENNFV